MTPIRPTKVRLAGGGTAYIPAPFDEVLDAIDRGRRSGRVKFPNAGTHRVKDIVSVHHGDRIHTLEATA